MASNTAIPHDIERQPKCFFDLPQELRNTIYELVLPIGQKIPSTYLSPYIFEPPLLAVNRQVRNDTIPIFYGQNIFIFETDFSIDRLMREISHEKMAVMQSIRIGGVPLPVYYVARMFEDFKSQHDDKLLSGLVSFPIRTADGVIWVGEENVHDFRQRSDNWHFNIRVRGVSKAKETEPLYARPLSTSTEADLGGDGSSRNLFDSSSDC